MGVVPAMAMAKNLSSALSDTEVHEDGDESGDDDGEEGDDGDDGEEGDEEEEGELMIRNLLG